MAREARQELAATRPTRPPTYGGTAASWRVLTDAIWPNAKSAESIMLAISYCSARKLDPFKRPVHIVPVWNSTLRREVETVWPGVSELLTTASRSKQFAGVDEPKWGPDETRTFEGTDRDGNVVRKTLTFPTSCTVVVWRLIGGERRAFSSPVYWTECYARQGRSEIPNDMWTKRPRGQFHKCGLAASLRVAFPEDIGSDYSAEEMEGKEVTSGGIIIDHEYEDRPEPAAAGSVNGNGAGTGHDTQADRRPAPSTIEGQREAAREEQSQAYAPPSIADQLSNEPDVGKWLLLVERLTKTAPNIEVLNEIRSDKAVRKAFEKAPTLIAAQLRETFRVAFERLAPAEEAEDASEAGEAGNEPSTPLAGLLAEVRAMDAQALAGLQTNAEWRQRVIDLFPGDAERLDEAIAERKLAIEAKDGERSTPPVS